MVKKKEENSGVKGLRLGMGIALGIIFVIILFFLFFDIGVEMKFEPVTPDGDSIGIVANPTITTEQEESFCPTKEEISISNSYTDDISGRFVVIFDKVEFGDYNLGGNSAMCIHGTTENQNVNYQYCVFLSTKINSDGTIISQDYVNVEIDPKTNEVLDIFC
ncbi:hypothetical protein KAJ87_00515 [Candidatus Pacearchaeota archaeon]|nr:hypothetical protein [Candidatus Pacearchaeota archaeon]